MQGQSRQTQDRGWSGRSRGNAGEVGEGVEEHDNGRLDLAAEETTEGFEFKGTILNAI